MMQLLVSFEFYIKNIYIFFFHKFFFFILIKSGKQIDTTDPFNKWVMLAMVEES